MLIACASPYVLDAIASATSGSVMTTDALHPYLTEVLPRLMGVHDELGGVAARRAGCCDSRLYLDGPRHSVVLLLLTAAHKRSERP